MALRRAVLSAEPEEDMFAVVEKDRGEEDGIGDGVIREGLKMLKRMGVRWWMLRSNDGGGRSSII